MSDLTQWLIGLLALVFPGLAEPEPTGFNGYVESDYVYVAAQAAGRIVAISVEEGDRVAEAQLLFSLENTQQVAAVQAAEARVEMAVARLDDLRTGSRAEEIAVIRAELARAKAERDLAAANLARGQRLLEKGNISQAQFDNERAALESARARVAEIEARLRVAELPARDSRRQAAEAELEAARAEAAAARAALDDRVVFSPVNGTVDRVFYETGEVAGAGAPVISILPEGGRKAIFFIPEARRAAFAIGDEMAVTCDGCGDGIRARITRFASAPQYTPPIIYSRDERSRLVFLAEAAIEDGSGLHPGQPITLEPLP
ncbi:MAG: HlyD family efflux transporter periplasmic adaptor subunit [Alphaproteobacteria bacterium]|nr:MAG: HlyD family efflux transporter periplasmic adaptor subunit [Alphaproteobacteria bacterium]